MELIQPTRRGQLVGQAPTVKLAPGKRLLLVDPYPRNNPYRLTASERRAVWFPKLSLPTIAAYTPASWEVSLVDEAVHDIDFDFPCDIVGLSMLPAMPLAPTRLQQNFASEVRRSSWGEFIPPTAPTKRFDMRMRSSVEKPKISGRN